MPAFHVRIELHGVRRMEQYKVLHVKMEEYGAFVVIKSSNGEYYRLPLCEYRIDLSAKIAWDVCTDIAAITNSLTDAGDPSPSIVVLEVVDAVFRLNHVPI